MTEDQLKRITENLMKSLKLPQEREEEVKRRVDLTTQAVLIKCNRKDVPEPLEAVIEMMCEDILKSEGIAGGGTGAVSSVTRGDTSISYRDDSAITEAALRLTKDYEGMLVRFKRMNLPKDGKRSEVLL